MAEAERKPEDQPGSPDFVRWGAGCLVGAAALLGMLVLVFLVSVALQPPTWVQIVVGVVLAVAGVVLAWLIANAVGEARTRAASTPRQPKQSLPPPRDEDV